MRTVRDDDGTLYVLLKESSDSSLVRDPATGDTEHRPNDDLEPAGGESPLGALATAVPEAVRTVLGACHDDWHLGVLVDLADRGPLAAREMLGSYDACESDFLGALTELRAAGLVAETTVGGERGYELTETGERGIHRLRD
ncbi:DUF7346 family protein [Halobacterium litoreum]|uniref:Transcriptional regulator n=1 Tax=Halobacterium litoreum TaxID=2039234 RepID=A0ABD5NHT0_9EURY|nr:hypothetical protein [Halobacterium litoreum]UHH12524.1 hypothetical protein LT972_10195 [Halobacterium litoreum]